MAARTQHPLIGRLIDTQNARGISGSEMSRRLGINPSTWTRLVAGDVQPSLRVVQAVASAFPELRSFCVDLLMIRRDTHEDSHNTTEVAS